MEIHASPSFKPPQLVTHRVFLNDVEMADVTYASEEAGMVAKIRRTTEGLPLVMGEFFQVEVLNGAVRIEEIGAPMAARVVVATPISDGEGPPAPPPARGF